MTKYINILNNEGEEKEVIKLFVVGPKESLEMETEMVLSAPRTWGNTIVKAVVAEGGMLTLKGMIRIKKEGRLANAFLRQNVLLLDKTAKAVVTPDLEIENNDVKASHAATVGRIDEEELFYLMSRGFDRNEARKMIVEAFLNEVKDKIDVEEWKKIQKKVKTIV